MLSVCMLTTAVLATGSGPLYTAAAPVMPGWTQVGGAPAFRTEVNQLPSIIDPRYYQFRRSPTDGAASAWPVRLGFVEGGGVRVALSDPRSRHVQDRFGEADGREKRNRAAAAIPDGGWTSLKEVNFGAKDRPRRPLKNAEERRGSPLSDSTGLRGSFLGGFYPARQNNGLGPAVATKSVGRFGLSPVGPTDNGVLSVADGSDGRHGGGHRVPDDVKLISKPILVTWT